MDAVIKKIPYGMTDFERIILENYYYVDKTQYIAKVEKVTSFFFFVRPRRFGKSLFLNMLGLYYDINQKDKFEKIFGNLYIGKHPTPDRNKYLVLTLYEGSGGNPVIRHRRRMSVGERGGSAGGTGSGSDGSVGDAQSECTVRQKVVDGLCVTVVVCVRVV